MANTTVYPFGTQGTLPGSVGIINDFVTGGADKALSAEMGKELHEMILEQTDTYGKIVPSAEYSGYMVDATGELASGTNFFVNEWPIDLVNNDYLGTYGYGATQTSIYSLNYYDEDMNWLGGAFINPGGDPLTIKTLAPLVFPSSWESDLDTYKALAKFVRITGYTNRDAILYETWTVPQSILAKPVTPNTITIFASLIRSPFPWSGKNDQTELVTENVVSPWGIVFPDTYSVGGTPTPVIAMLHGSEGYVGEGCLGYTNTAWVTWREQYLAAGFAVMDINGYGVSTEPDEKSVHWGCPLAIETLDKAFEFLRQNYNICDKLLIHGTSMGGALAQGYAKVNPGKVYGVGLFAPSVIASMARYNTTEAMAVAWGYTDAQEMAEDGYSHLTGFAPLNECFEIEAGGNIKKMDWTDYADNSEAASANPIDFFPVRTMVWQGTGDLAYRKNNTDLLVNGLRNGNSPVFVRYCTDEGHDLMLLTYVRNEAVDWFKRFISTQNISE